MENMVMDFSFYRDKKIFLTGHTGFKGSWMLTWLYNLGAHVKGYALEPKSGADLFNLIKGVELCETVFGDILDYEKLEKEIVDFEPDFIFHFAAQPLVRLSYEIPDKTFEINALGTAYVLNSVRKLKNFCAVILITTDKVYENLEWYYPYRENDRLGGYDPYSASKACAELIINSYRSSFFNKKNFKEHQKSIASARAGNVIGGGDWAKDRIIPDLINALKNNKPIPVRNPHAIRPWQHVLEPLSGYLQLALKMVEDPVKYSESWNFGPHLEDNLTVYELVSLAMNIWGDDGVIEEVKTATPLHEAGLLKLDINKSIAELGWKPKMTARDAIDTTIKWYKNFSNGFARLLIEKDILVYSQKN